MRALMAMSVAVTLPAFCSLYLLDFATPRIIWICFYFMFSMVTGSPAAAIVEPVEQIAVWEEGRCMTDWAG